jgi:hypothetical protein
MGIFGYLSKAHIDSTIVSGANTVQLRNIEAQEKIAKERLTYLLQRAGDPATATNRIDRQIQETQAEIKRLTTEKLPLLAEENKLTAEIGPIKYVAELFFDKADPSFIDKAVRSVIITIIIVFDPLAILLLIAAQKTFKQTRKKKIITVENGEEQIIEVDDDDDIVIQYDMEDINEVIPKSKITKLDGGSF